MSGRNLLMSDKAASNPDSPSSGDTSQQEGLVIANDGRYDPVVMAAWLYYHEGLTQAEIAGHLGVSRPSVANLLAKARSEGVVTISLRADYLSNLTLSKEFKRHFGLTDVLIVPTPEGADTLSVNRSIGKAGALYLERNLKPGDIFATAWGATVLEVATALSGTTVDNLTIAQSLGGLSTADAFNPSRVASLMADKLGARLYHLYVPAVVESEEVRDILLRDRSIKTALDVTRTATIAMLGIGKVAHDATVVKAGFIMPAQIDELSAKGAVGDIAGRFFDINGQLVPTELDRRIIALTLEEIREISPVIAVVGGREKVRAVLGALRGGYLDVLIIDERTAKAVLMLDKKLQDEAN